jgi:hypothetical protein
LIVRKRNIMACARSPFPRRLRAYVALTVLAALAACGGNVNTTPLASPSGFSSFSAAAVNGLSVVFNVAAGAPLGTTATATSAITAPSGVPAPSAIQRQAQAIAGAAPFLYTSVVLSQPISAALVLNEVLTSTNALSANVSYSVEIDDPSATPPKLTTIAGTLANGIVTFTNASASFNASQIFAANHVYVFQFYDVTITPPSPTPSPPPPGVLSVNPTTVQLVGIGSSNAANVLVQETGDSGAFSESDTCAGVATVTSSSATGPEATFTVTGISAGACNATFSDTFGQHVTIPVGVNVLNVPVI